MKLKITAILIAIATISFTACKKEKQDVIPSDPYSHEDSTHHHDTTTKAGSFMIHFDNKVGDEDMQLGSTWYTAPSGDTFQVTVFNYYISNIVFTRMDGTKYAEPESYHLVKEDDAASQMFTIKDIPAGHYTSVSFMIGVDEARNTSGAQTGALDPINGMFWSWNTGYIMAKMEGKAPVAADGEFMYHIGGFEGDNNVLKTVSFDFKEHKVVDENTIHVHFNADAKKWFHGTHDIDFAKKSKIHMPGAMAKMIADNYASMFTQKDH